MTDMSKEAMKLALEALEQLRTPLRVNTSLDAYDVGRAITALRKALAENPAQQEPVGEVEQIDIDEDGQASAWFRLNDNVELGDKLYTRHQAREPLTDEQMRKVHHEDQFGLFCDYDEFEQIARAIEAKLKEKNT